MREGSMTTATHMQIDVHGEEEPYALVAARNRAHRELSGAQREILTSIRVNGPIRAVEAGVMIHAARNARLHRLGCSGGAKGYGRTKLACCHYAAADGHEAMKRLARRGLVTQGEDKRWSLA